MNIELEEVVQDVSDDALELAAGGAQGGGATGGMGCCSTGAGCLSSLKTVLATSDEALELAAGGAQGGAEAG
jgi:hypothetical protein